MTSLCQSCVSALPFIFTVSPVLLPRQPCNGGIYGNIIISFHSNIKMAFIIKMCLIMLIPCEGSIAPCCCFHGNNNFSTDVFTKLLCYYVILHHVQIIIYFINSCTNCHLLPYVYIHLKFIIVLYPSHFSLSHDSLNCQL